MVDTAAFSLHRNAYGRLVYVSADGRAYEGVVPVRAFPISNPSSGLSLLDAQGHELLWLESLDDLSVAMRQLVREEMESREFVPEIQSIVRVSSFSTPSVWHVKTDRGDTSFTLKGEEDIRRLSGQTLLVADSHGIHYLLRDIQALDKHSRKVLDRFL